MTLSEIVARISWMFTGILPLSYPKREEPGDFLDTLFIIDRTMLEL